MFRPFLLIFFFSFILQSLGAKEDCAEKIVSKKGLLSSFASLSFQHEPFQSTAKLYKSVFLKKKTRKNRGTKLRSAPVPGKRFSLPNTYGSTSFFFSSEFVLIFRSVTPPHRGPPATI
jgi:hypothetical protein